MKKPIFLKPLNDIDFLEFTSEEQLNYAIKHKCKDFKDASCHYTYTQQTKITNKNKEIFKKNNEIFNTNFKKWLFEKYGNGYSKEILEKVFAHIYNYVVPPNFDINTNFREESKQVITYFNDGIELIKNIEPIVKW